MLHYAIMWQFKWIVIIIISILSVGSASWFISWKLDREWISGWIKNMAEKKEWLPGVSHLSSDLINQFKVIKKQRGLSYRPRTRHLSLSGQALFTNRLFLERSPYLLQHAHNPVNWYPWGEEPFAVARQKNIPVLLSIGYSTCHWCHVMEEESFEDLEIARYLNEHYVAIKVDREERPDIDAIYMSVVQLTTGHGGWPMTVWLTADKKPFYGGTYFPARTGDRGRSMGFLPLLKTLHKLYYDKADEIKQQGIQIQQQVQKMLAPTPIGSEESLIPSKDIFYKLQKQVQNRLDTTYGGTLGAPKFPSSLPIRALLRSYLKTKNSDTLNAIQLSLKGMSNGGLRDHVGGGFHRYSTDKKWLVPHFEKMLYDQALLALAYLEAFNLLKDKNFKETAQQILDYVARDMQSPNHGFYSATDADSTSLNGKKEEGYYFTWTLNEIDKALNTQEAQLVKSYYGITKEGNFENRNILHITKDLSLPAKELKLSVSEAKNQLYSAREKLYKVRNQRALPLRDEKILTSWNGLMISAFVHGFLALGDKKYFNQALSSAQFIWNNLQTNGNLYHSWKEEKAYIAGYLDDYAFFLQALLDLFVASGDLQWLEKAIILDQVLEKEFEDKTHGGFFMTSHRHETLMAREKPIYDGAEPSGNSVTILNLLRLNVLTAKKSYRKRAERAFRLIGSRLNNHPMSYSDWMIALDYYHSRVYEIVLVVPASLSDRNFLFQDPLFREINEWYLPHSAKVFVSDSEVKKYTTLLPPLAGKKVMGNKSTVYICEKGACQLPTSDLKTLKQQLKNIQSTSYL